MSTDDNKDIDNAAKVLDSDHYGMKDIKERILESLAVRNITGSGKAPVICLAGPPGTGKTSIARSVAKALGKEYVRICLGGVRDEAEIRGHRKHILELCLEELLRDLRVPELIILSCFLMR